MNFIIDSRALWNSKSEWGFIVLLLLFTDVKVNSQTTDADSDTCINGPTAFYTGTKNTTKDNVPCLRWDAAPTSSRLLLPRDGGAHNYCRNPSNNVQGVWCYTSFQPGNQSEQFCGVRKCETDARTLWTAINVVNKTTHIFSINADPEYTRDQVELGNSISVQQHRRVAHPSAEFWSLTSDYDSKQLFYADYRSEVIGVYNLTSRTSKEYFDGMGHGVESMGYDPISKNLYWADSSLKWIMAANPTLQYYTVVYKTDPDPAYALAIHVPKRLLFFSTFRTLKSRLWRMDMGGNNATAIVSSPTIEDVTGLTIDYETDRLYWTDYTQISSSIWSSRLDGTNITLLYVTRNSVYWGVAIYQNWVYVTDVRTRRAASTGALSYFIWMISKTKNTNGNRRILHYGVNTKARGITVYQKSNITSQPSANPVGECNASAQCAHVCLPSLNGTRTCKCSLGYKKSGEVDCVTTVPDDEFLILADSGQGKVFFLPLSATNESEYSLLPIQDVHSVYSMAFNARSRLVFWSDTTNASIFRSTFDGRNVTRITTNKHAKRMAVDPQTGYVYFTEFDFGRIFVMNEYGGQLKTLYKYKGPKGNSSNIQSIALDLKNKYIYWTDSFSANGQGQLQRMRFDGSQRKIIYSNLLRPHGVAVDLEQDRLYLGEATTPLIYEIPLSSINESAKARLPNDEATRHILSATFRRPGNTYLSDIKIANGQAYFYDVGNKSIEVYNLTSRTVKTFGPREFFRVRSIDVFRRTYYEQFEATTNNPCRGNCDQLCLATSNFTFDCDCQDGYVLDGGSRCRPFGREIDNPPVFDYCSHDIDISLQACQNMTPVTLREPKWSDDITATKNLVLTRPNTTSPALLPVGTHTFTYTATDESKQTGTCSFQVRVTRGLCSRKPPLRSVRGVNESDIFCNDNATELLQNIITPTYIIRCPPGQYVLFQGKANLTLVNFCTEQNRWFYNNFFGLRCGTPDDLITTRPAATTPLISVSKQTSSVVVSLVSTAVASTITASTTAASTTAPSTTIASTTAASTTVASTTIVSTTTVSTTAAAATTASITTVATTAASTTAASTTTASTTPTTRPSIPRPTKSTTTLGNANRSPYNPRPHKAKTLSVGAVVGIAILCFVLVVILVAVVVMRAKKSGSPSIFPLFWKQKEDTQQLQPNVFDEVNHYTVL